MMGRRKDEQGQFFYSFDLDKVVPPDHLVRQIDGVLDLGWVHKELAPYYSHTGRPSIDPVLMIRMLIVGYVFAIRSERRLCSEVQVNLASRWFWKLGIDDDPGFVVDEIVGVVSKKRISALPCNPCRLRIGQRDLLWRLASIAAAVRTTVIGASLFVVASAIESSEVLANRA